MALASSDKSYVGDFYSRRRDLTLLSAREIFDVLCKVHQAESVVDFGCGTGTWLSVAKEKGAQRLLGFEGSWVNESMLDTDGIQLINRDLEEPVDLDERFDLAISLEVAEHLSQDRAASFVEELCRAAPCILFSAAIPHQGGRHHVNEQWQSYWTAFFAKQGFRPIDLIRPRIWDREAIPFYYRQNTILYADSEHFRLIQNRLADHPQALMLDVVHPVQQKKILEERPGTKESLEILLRLPSTLWSSVRRRLSA